MEHHLRTSYGDSDEFFICKDSAINFHGAGQGNGFAPCIWAAISTVMLEVLKDEGFGSAITSSITNLVTSLVAFAFVDDTDLVTIGKENDTLDEVIQKMQKLMKMWQGMLRTTGGALVPHKSWFVPIAFRW